MFLPRSLSVIFTACLLICGLTQGAEIAWEQFSFQGDPWDKNAKPEITRALNALTVDPLGSNYRQSATARREALETLDASALLGPLRRDVEALLEAKPDSVEAAYILSELDEFEREEPYTRAIASIGFPVWIKLERKGDLITISISKDGSKWNEEGKCTALLQKALTIGIYVRSGLADKACQVAIDSVNLQFPDADKGQWKTGTLGETYGPATFEINGDAWTVSGMSAAKTLEGAFISKQVSGDGSFIARINSMEDTGDGARAGLLITDSSTTPEFSLLAAIRPDGGLSIWGERWEPASVKSLQRLAKLVPGDEAIVVRLARSLYYARRYREAVDLILPMLERDPASAYYVDLETMVKLLERKETIGEVAAALRKWDGKAASETTISRCGPYLLMAQALRDADQHAAAIELVHRGLELCPREDDLILLPYYLNLLEEAGRLKEGADLLVKTLQEEAPNQISEAAILGSQVLNPVTREEPPRLILLLQFAKKMGVLPQLLEEGKLRTFISHVKRAGALAYLADDQFLEDFAELAKKMKTGNSISNDEGNLLSWVGEAAFTHWPESRPVALSLMKYAAEQIPDGHYGSKIFAWHRVADAARTIEDFDTVRLAAEAAASARIRSREMGVGNYCVVQFPPFEFKTAQLLKASGSELSPFILTDPYQELDNVPAAEALLTNARLAQVLTKLKGEPNSPDAIAFPIPVVGGDSKLAIEIAPGPMHSAHEARLAVGHPVRFREFDKWFDLKLWYGPNPRALELGEEIEAAPDLLIKDWPAGLGFLQIRYRKHGSKEPFQKVERTFPIMIGKNLAQDPKLADIQPGTTEVRPKIDGWSELPFGLFTAGDLGPLPDVPTLRFIPRHSQKTQHLEMGRIPVTPGKRYFQSVWLRSPSRLGTINAGVRFLDANGERIGTSRCGHDYDDPRWLFTSQILTTGQPQGTWETKIPEGTAFLQPVLSVWIESDWCGHFVAETD